jgi:hypothetical protein
MCVAVSGLGGCGTLELGICSSFYVDTLLGGLAMLLLLLLIWPAFGSAVPRRHEWTVGVLGALMGYSLQDCLVRDILLIGTGVNEWVVILGG